jgi:acetyl esterase/lipase
MSEFTDMIRFTFKEGDDKRDAGLTTPEDVVRYDDIVYGEDDKWQILDVYRPKDLTGALPVIVSVHGGAWVYGDKELYQYYCMDLAQRGFAVVNFTYRLAPEYQFPASIEDTNLVFTWVLEHAAQYGFDTERIFAVGDSAGAHTLGLYTAICTNLEYAKEYKFAPPKGFAPKAVGFNCGVYQVTLDREEDANHRALMAEYLPGKGTETEMERIDVAKHVTKDFPPVFIMTATADFLMDQPANMIHRFMEEKVPFVFRFYGDAEHDLGHVFHVNVRSQEGRVCNDEECEFFRNLK